MGLKVVPLNQPAYAGYQDPQYLIVFLLLLFVDLQDRMLEFQQQRPAYVDNQRVDAGS